MSAFHQAADDLSTSDYANTKMLTGAWPPCNFNPTRNSFGNDIRSSRHTYLSWLQRTPKHSMPLLSLSHRGMCCLAHVWSLWNRNALVIAPVHLVYQQSFVTHRRNFLHLSIERCPWPLPELIWPFAIFNGAGGMSGRSDSSLSKPNARSHLSLRLAADCYLCCLVA